MCRGAIPFCGTLRATPSAEFLIVVVVTVLLIGGSASAMEQKWSFANATSVVELNGSIVAGRVNAAISDPRYPNVMYIATDGARPTGQDGDPSGKPAVGLPDTGGGGVWKTINWLSDNPNWVALTDNMPSLSVGPHGLAIAPSSPDVLYAAADGPQGAILKTKDAGKHWYALAEDLFFGVKFGGIAISATNPDEVYVAVFRAGTNPRTGRTTPAGLYKSVDGGTKWKLVLAGATSHFVIDPRSDHTLYAGIVDPANSALQGVWKTKDGGRTWSPQANNFPAGTFDSTFYIELAIAPSATQTLYTVVMTQVNNLLPRFYSTGNGGKDWNEICRTTDADADNRFWHQVLTVHPQNPLIVFAEGKNHIGVFTTSGGQSTIACDGAWSVFWTGDDPAGISFYDDPTAPGGLAFAAFGDRGIYRVANTTNPSDADFTPKQGDLANPLLVSLQVDPTQSSSLYGIGFDQTGALYASAATEPFWHKLPVGSEFGKTVVNPGDPSILYNLCPVGDPDAEPDVGGLCDPTNFITRQSGGAWAPIVGTSFSESDFPFSRSVQTDPATWKSLEFDPATQDGVLYGGIDVWAWSSSSGKFVKLTPQPLVNADQDTTSFISAFGIAQSNPAIVYVGTSEGTIFVTNGRTNWAPVTGLTLPQSAFPSRIQVNPYDSNQLVTAVQGTTGPGRVWAGHHGGSDWTDLTRDLPPGLQVYTVAVDWRFPNPQLYLGTDRGVYASGLERSLWRPFGEGLPNTLVSDLEITPTGVMTAALYGRGAYQLRLPPPK
jgi:hypothetical protein